MMVFSVSALLSSVSHGPLAHPLFHFRTDPASIEVENFTKSFASRSDSKVLSFSYPDDVDAEMDCTASRVLRHWRSQWFSLFSISSRRVVPNSNCFCSLSLLRIIAYVSVACAARVSALSICPSLALTALESKSRTSRRESKRDSVDEPFSWSQDQLIYLDDYRSIRWVTSLSLAEWMSINSYIDTRESTSKISTFMLFESFRYLLCSCHS
jgi:hypothetical protein